MAYVYFEHHLIKGRIYDDFGLRTPFIQKTKKEKKRNLVARVVPGAMILSGFSVEENLIDARCGRGVPVPFFGAVG